MLRFPALLLALCLAPSALAGADVYTTRGDNAFASAVAPIDDCSYAQLTIWYSAETSHAAGTGKPSDGALSWGWWDIYNSCEGTFEWTDGTSPGFTVTTSSSSASISGRIDLVDWFTGEDRGSVEFSISIAGTETSKGISNVVQTMPWGQVRQRSVGTNASGDVSGTAGGLTIDSGFGTYGSSSSGSITKIVY